MADVIKICTSCGSTGFKKETPGHFAIELILWLCWLIPGLIYSIWRISNKKEICSSCGGTTRIPLNSPRGKKIKEEFASYEQA